MNNNNNKNLSVFKLAMMSVVAIDSLKNLPINAQYGTSLIIFYAIAIITFFIPSALVSAELATTFPETGGVYIWIKKAFGKKTAFSVIWIQWMIAIIWYPTILSFIVVTIFYLFDPKLAENKFLLLAIILLLFWSATFLISKGIRISSMISTWSAILGVILPMVFIIALGIYWLIKGHKSQILLSEPIELNQNNLRLFITLLYSLMGMEMIAAHAGDVSKPERGYPIALLISASIILITIIPASLAIAIVIPHEKIGIISGVVESFMIFLNEFKLEWIKPLIVIAIAVGSFGIFYTWLLNASRCLTIAANDGCLPHFFQKNNNGGMSSNQLILQGVFFTILSSFFVLLPSITMAFWFLTAACAQLALLYYIFIFCAAIKLRYKKPNVTRPFRIGKHPISIWIICIVPIMTLLIAFLFGFLPPPEISSQDILKYEFFLIALISFSFIFARVIIKKDQNLTQMT